MTNVDYCPNQFCLIFSTSICLVSHDIAQSLLTVMTGVSSSTSVIAITNYWAIAWLTRHSPVENIRQNGLGQESRSVIAVSNYLAISWLIRHILVENISIYGSKWFIPGKWLKYTCMFSL
jgi:hypothetical protein